MLGRPAAAAAWFGRAGARWRESFAAATETSWGRPIGAVKAALLAGDDGEAAAARRLGARARRRRGAPRRSAATRRCWRCSSGVATARPAELAATPRGPRRLPGRRRRGARGALAAAATRPPTRRRPRPCWARSSARGLPRGRPPSPTPCSSCSGSRGARGIAAALPASALLPARRDLRSRLSPGRRPRPGRGRPRAAPRRGGAGSPAPPRRSRRRSRALTASALSAPVDEQDDPLGGEQRRQGHRHALDERLEPGGPARRAGGALGELRRAREERGDVAVGPEPEQEQVERRRPASARSYSAAASTGVRARRGSGAAPGSRREPVEERPPGEAVVRALVVGRDAALVAPPERDARSSRARPRRRARRPAPASSRR